MRHFIDLAEWSSAEIRALVALALELKAAWKHGGNAPLLKGKVLALVFQKPSLRTRVSFEVGMMQLGGTAINLGPDEIGLGKRESVADIARSLSAFTQGIMARVFDHDHLTELAHWGSVPVINGLSDTQHPCQALADVLTIHECFGSLDGVTVAFVGDANNVAFSLAQAVAHLGGHFRIAHPPGYGFSETRIDSVAAIAEANGGSIALYEQPQEAVHGAQVVYTDTWVSMGQEHESERRIRAMQPYQVNAALLREASPNAIVMHCLPAHRGQEITDDVADGAQSVMFHQAENRLHAQKAVLATLLGG
ncbi:MAG: ornithine carbamoyltransferase [bacterium]|nr:ornithine carbamoyltransferase [bacterium]